MSERTVKANQTVSRYWKWSFGAGLIPIPLVDVAAVTGLQVKMIYDLAKLYEIPFSHDRAKSIVSALIGGIAPPVLSATTLNLLGPALKMIPGVGTVLGVIATPVFSSATTSAVGRVFVQHFESGGTFLDLDPDKVREHFRKEFEAATQQKNEATAAR